MYWSPPAPGSCHVWVTTTSTTTTTTSTTAPPASHVCLEKCPAGAGACDRASNVSLHEPCQMFEYKGQTEYHCNLGKPGELVAGAEHRNLTVPSEAGILQLGTLGDITTWVWPKGDSMYWSALAPASCQVWGTTTTSTTSTTTTTSTNTTTTTTTRTTTSPPFGSICVDNCPVGAGTCTRASEDVVDEPCKVFENEAGESVYHCKLGFPGELIQGAEQLNLSVPSIAGRHLLGEFGDVVAWVWDYDGKMFWAPPAPGSCQVWVTTTTTTTTTRTVTSPPFGSICDDKCPVGAGRCTRAEEDTLGEPCKVFEGNVYHCKLGKAGDAIEGAERLGLLVPDVKGQHLLGEFGDVLAWVWGPYNGQMYWSVAAPGSCHVWVTTTTTTTTTRTVTSPPLGSVCYDKCPIGAGKCTRAAGDAWNEPCKVFLDEENRSAYHCRLGSPGDPLEGAEQMGLLVPDDVGQHVLGEFGDVLAWVWLFKGEMYWSLPAPGDCQVWVTTTTTTSTTRTITSPPPNSTCVDMCPVGAGSCVKMPGCSFEDPCMIVNRVGAAYYHCKLGKSGDPIDGADVLNLTVPDTEGFYMLGEYGDVGAYVWEFEDEMYWSLAAPNNCQVFQPPVLPTSARGSSGFSILAWADEFDYTGFPDPATWTFEVGDLRVNEELQYYTDHLENAWVSDGTLKIRALKQDFGGKNYTSARLITKDKRSVLYGHVEVRARIPEGRGSWPAVWLHPSNDTYGAWPKSGELDIMESAGNEPHQVKSSIHTFEKNWHMNNSIVGHTCVQHLQDWHFYSIDWTKSSIKFFVDGNLLLEYEADGTGQWETWPFNKPFFLLLNIAVGGNMGGEVDDAAFQGDGQVMEIDYIRVYS
mmetsp:Transcript_15626/g.28201  ORF Transcript_15626/g.28201 Transcript_15626/m.28201 type:complete len:860 (+) Transcript_15626:1-2580(+)